MDVLSVGGLNLSILNSNCKKWVRIFLRLLTFSRKKSDLETSVFFSVLFTCKYLVYLNIFEYAREIRKVELCVHLSTLVCC